MRWCVLVVCACSGATTAPSTPVRPEVAIDAGIDARPEVAIDAGIDPSIDPVLRDRGAQLFQDKGCIGCHSLDGTFRIGPPLIGAWGKTVALTDGTQVIVDEAYVRESIMKPLTKQRAGFVPVMPEFGDRIAPDELDALVAFIHSLR
jgi:cytochrome c oxidase subunit 2